MHVALFFSSLKKNMRIRGLHTACTHCAAIIVAEIKQSYELFAHASEAHLLSVVTAGRMPPRSATLELWLAAQRPGGANGQ